MTGFARQDSMQPSLAPTVAKDSAVILPPGFGCHSAFVDAFSFQGPGFYPRLGYEIFEMLDYPPDHKRISLRNG